MDLLRYKIYTENGSTLSYKKPVLVLIHGFGGGCATWICQIHSLKKHYDLLLLELPSHGKSKLKMSQLAPNFDSISNLILNVLDHLGIQKASFAGVSLGTLAIQHFVLHHSERVDKYMLMGAVGKLRLWHKLFTNTIWWLLPILPLKATVRLVATVIIPYNELAYGRELFIASAKRIGREELRVWFKVLLSFSKEQEQYAKQMGREENCLYILGEKDFFFRKMLGSETSRIQNLVIVKDAGHLCCIDQHAAVNDLIVQFQKNGCVSNQETLV